MQRIRLRIFFALVLAPVALHAQGRTGSLWNDTSWSATGSQTNEEYGVTLSYLGAFDSATNALAIGESGGASWILNKKKLDTATVYFAPGNTAIPCKLEDSPFPDYVLGIGHVIVLLGRDTNKFDTIVIPYGGSPLVADVDSSGYQSVLTFQWEADSPRVYWFHGGPTFDTIPQIIYHKFNGGAQIGNIRDTSQKYLCYLNQINSDTSIIYPTPLGKSFSNNASLINDSIICVTTQWNGNYSGAYSLDNVDGDNISDIILGGGGKVLIFKGGDTISPQPTYKFIPPASSPNIVTFGTKIVDIGSAVSPNYHSLLITDPSYGGDLYSEPGAIFLYNIGKGLDSNCAAYATEAAGTEGLLGTSAIGIGKYPGDTLDGFMVGAAERVNVEYNMGEIFAFKGNSAHGTSSVIRTRIIPPQIFSLSQNYPNPVSGTTTITLSVLDNSLVGSEVTLELYDALGRFVRTLFRSKAADGYEYTIGMSTAGLPEGNYFYRLSAGGKETARMMSVMK